jgi:hypothetical protein
LLVVSNLKYAWQNKERLRFCIVSLRDLVTLQKGYSSDTVIPVNSVFDKSFLETCNSRLANQVLEYCALDDIIYLRSHYIDQPEGEELTILTMPIYCNKNNRRYLFRLKHIRDKSRYIDVCSANPENVMSVQRWLVLRISEK